MKREEFIEILSKERYSYETAGDKIIVTAKNTDVFNLERLKSIPSGVEFKNLGHVVLDSLKTLPSNVEFNNEGNVYLRSLKKIPPSVVFNNRKDDVYLDSLIGDWFDMWEGNIEGIDHKRLLNVMISKGLFKR